MPVRITGIKGAKLPHNRPAEQDHDMTRIFILTTAIAAGLVVADGADAFGGRNDTPERPSFTQLDANADGKVTLAEFQAYPARRAAERFTAVDTNGDGKLSKDEMAAANGGRNADRLARRVDAMFDRLDGDKDGFVSAEEMAAAGRGADRRDPGSRFFDRFDSDKDGAISAGEYAQAEQMMQKGGNGKRGASNSQKGGFGRN